MKLYTWGANSYGQLGVGYKSEQILTPEEINLDFLEGSKITSISGGAGHTLILDDLGTIYSTGWNHKGQLGHSQEETLKFKKIEPPCNHGMEKISCGWDFSAAICKYGDVYVWGSNNFNQIGLKGVKDTPRPTLLKGIKAQSVSCGVRHMGLVTVENKSLICGNGNKGQLGLTENILTQAELMRIPELDDVTSVSCGQFHTLALKNDGAALSWGHNKFGQLGHDQKAYENIFTPKKIDFDATIKSVHTGWTHSAFLTQNNEVFTFGRSSYGQLGRLELEKNWKPQKINIERNVKSLALGSEHNLAVTEDGKCFAWGWNEHGNCGTGDMEDVKVPKQILEKENITFVSCGTGQSFAVSL